MDKKCYIKIRSNRAKGRYIRDVYMNDALLCSFEGPMSVIAAGIFCEKVEEGTGAVNGYAIKAVEREVEIDNLAEV